MVRFKEGEPCCICPCPCEGVIDIIGKKWVLCVLALLGNNGTMRFTHLLGQLPGMSAKTLTDVLKDLQRTGLCETGSVRGDTAPGPVPSHKGRPRANHPSSPADGVGGQDDEPNQTGNLAGFD